MMTARKRALFIEALSIVAPIVCVYFGRGLLAGPIQTATVVQVGSQALPAITGYKGKALLPEQVKAMDWIAKTGPSQELVSPLNHPVSIVTVEPTQPDPEPNQPVALPPRGNPAEGLKLTAVVGNESEQLASINGKIFKLNQWVRPGLKLTEIDARNSRIILTESDGTTHELKREQK